jgi:hypothetical protein
LYPASFSFSPAIADGALQEYRMCDWIDNALALEMSRSAQGTYGYIHLPCRLEVNPRVKKQDNPAASHSGSAAASAMEKSLG